MTELVYTEQALLDLERLGDFLLETDPQAAQDTAVLIFEALEILVQHPEIGRKVHFGQREPVTITRHGRTAAFMVSPQDMQDLQEARRKRGTAVEAFGAYFAKADATLTPAARELTDEDVTRMVKESR